MKLSIIIPAHNEEECIVQTMRGIVEELNKEKIEYEIIVVNDNSSDNTRGIVDDFMNSHSGIKLINRHGPCGFGRAVKEGLSCATGDALCIVMGDLSDEPKDIVRCFRKIEEGYDCVFGSRFMKGSIVKDYPSIKLLINRLANTFIRALFLTRANDITNAFKFYRREVIKSIEPLQALYFNITVEPWQRTKTTDKDQYLQKILLKLKSRGCTRYCCTMTTIPQWNLSLPSLKPFFTSRTMTQQK